MFNISLMEIFDQCEARGFVPPFIVCTVSAIGDALVVRANGDGTPADVLADHFKSGDDFEPPFTIVVVDQRNEAARLPVTAAGEKTWH